MMQDYFETPVESPMPGAWPLSFDVQRIAAEREPQFMASSRSRYSPQLRGKTFARSAVSFRDQFELMEAPHTITSASRQIPGSARDHFHTSRIANNVSRRRSSPVLQERSTGHNNESTISSPRQEERDPSLHALLVPDICVTPETRVVDSGYHNFWVAIEVVARWHVPGQDDADAAGFSGRRPLYSTHSSDFGRLYGSP